MIERLRAIRGGEVAETGGRDVAMAASRRRLVVDGSTIAMYAIPVGLVYGVLAREAGFTLLDVVATCVLVLAGGAQFAAVAMVKAGVPIATIVGVTALVNARHLLYSAALAPFASSRRLRERALMAHFLTDETFALALAHFRRIGGFDARGYWLASLLILVPWTGGSAAGYLASGAIGDTHALGIDVVFPAAMAGLAVGMISGRREIVAAVAAVAIAVVVALAAGTALGLVAGGVLGPVVAILGVSEASNAAAGTAPEASPAAGEEAA